MREVLTGRGECLFLRHSEKQHILVLVGVQDRVEIWDKALWEEKSQISEEDLDAIAERMEAIGIRI